MQTETQKILAEGTKLYQQTQDRVRTWRSVARDLLTVLAGQLDTVYDTADLLRSYDPNDAEITEIFEKVAELHVLVNNKAP